MRFGEVCVLSGNVRKLADFYRLILGIEGCADGDDTWQLLLDGDVRLVIWDDGTPKTNNNTNMCLAFTCDDVDVEYQRLKELEGIRIHFVEAPHDSLHGYRSMCFYDIDGNKVFFRSSRTIGGHT